MRGQARRGGFGRAPAGSDRVGPGARPLAVTPHGRLVMVVGAGAAASAARRRPPPQPHAALVRRPQPIALSPAPSRANAPVTIAVIPVCNVSRTLGR